MDVAIRITDKKDQPVRYFDISFLPDIGESISLHKDHKQQFTVIGRRYDFYNDRAILDVVTGEYNDIYAPKKHPKN